ncbi:hypothetical protein KAU11_04480 [Candidatus Babeliales bacterium]|nr:hypothetical protein [Candidatus Babeliales bacterium]
MKEITDEYFGFMEKNIGTILSTLIISFIVGTFAMIYNIDKNNQIFSTRLGFILTSIDDIKRDISGLERDSKLNLGNRWTRDDHKEFSNKIDLKLNLINNKIDHLNNRIKK